MGSCLDISTPTLQHDHKLSIEEMHKTLNDYLMSSQADLLGVVRRIGQMVTSQYNKYMKQNPSAKHTLKFKHSLGSMPFLPLGSMRLLNHQQLSASENKICSAKIRTSENKSSLSHLYVLVLCRHTS
jgi:hypothetical protein